MTVLNWLHISDFHFKAGSAYEQDLVLTKLLDFLEFRMKNERTRPDLIFATGDVGNTGARGEYIEATKFFDRLLSITKLQKERLIIVPGNHDTDRKACKSLTATLKDEVSADEFFDGAPILHITTKMSAFANWYNDYFNGVSLFSDTSSCSAVRNFEINGHKVKVLPLNTAIFCHGDEDQGKLWLSRRCLDQAFEGLGQSETYLKIALMHHPLEWLSEIEVSHIRSRLYDNFDCILNGHLHRTDIQQVNGINGNALHLAAGAAYQGGQWPKRALFCTWNGEGVKVEPLTYIEDPSECWALDAGVYSQEADYTKYYSLPKFNSAGKGAEGREISIVAKSPLVIEAEAKISAAKKLFESELISTQSGEVLFSKPRITSIPQDVYMEGKIALDEISIAEIVFSNENYIIESKSEYGGTTLARKMLYDILLDGNANALIEDCRNLSKYRSKLESELNIDKLSTSKKNVLILDNFQHDQHDRLLNEILKFSQIGKIIVIARNGAMNGGSLFKPDIYAPNFKLAYIWAMSRQELRSLAAAIFGYTSIEDASEIVDKVYSDLLALRIPLTPANVIMYLKILYRDNDFNPINRTEIIGRYLVETLRKPTDILTDSFNAKSKIDFISAFIYYLHDKELESFDDNVWNLYVKTYKESKLIEFDGDKLLSELCESRVFVKFSGIFYLKYSFFFSYFIGNYISQKHNALATFISNKDYYILEGVAEVVSGLVSDNSALMESLVIDLEVFVAEFSERYISKSYDPFLETIWEKKPEEEIKWWDELTASIEVGPPSSKEIDVIKTNTLSEAKTVDQRVRFERLKRLEDDIFRTCKLLEVSLRNSNDTSGELKLRCLKAMFDCFSIGFQTGTMIAPVLSHHSKVMFGGALFLNFNSIRALREKEALESGEGVSEGVILSSVVANLSLSISKVTAENLGLKKLIPLFNKYMQEVNPSDGRYGFRDLMLLYCILESKGKNWVSLIEKIIARTKRSAYYLQLMLFALLGSIQDNNVITVRERAEVKRLISIIRAKRDLRTERPGAGAVARVLGVLEENNYFD